MEDIQEVFIAEEEAHGIRFSWNIWPANKKDAQQAILPLGCIYTPLKGIENLALVSYEPVQCRARECNAILNPYCIVDFPGRFWICCFCGMRNPFSPVYAENISATALPVELQQEHASIEYVLGNTSMTHGMPTSVFLFVVDMAVSEEEFNSLKGSIQHAISIMPPNTSVGLISFGRIVYLHELGCQEVSKAYCFQGDAELSPANLSMALGLSTRNDPRGGLSSSGAAATSRFVLPVEAAEFTITSILDELKREISNSPDQRAPRCMGQAINIAVGLMETSFVGCGGRILVFCGGPCTLGVGQVVGLPNEEIIRSYEDIHKNTSAAKHVKKAQKFYEGVAVRAQRAGHAVDIFACHVDQCGLFEMKVLVEKTGGCLIMTDTFSCMVFHETLCRIFEVDDNGFCKFGLACKMEVLTSKDVKVMGAIGLCTSLKKKGPCTSLTTIGEHSTCQWDCAVLDRSSSLAFYFEITADDKNDKKVKAPQDRKYGMLQFQTCYIHGDGRRRLRVTTVCKRYGEPESPVDLQSGFDQYAAAVLVARSAVFKRDTDEPLDVIRWLDRSLIRLMSRFANYRQEDPNSFRLSAEFFVFPQLMYHLRRSNLLQSHNSSLDESSFHRVCFKRENVVNCLLMIRPALMEYSFNSNVPRPVSLDVSSLKPTIVLLLDAFFHIVVWRGETVQQWYENEYHLNPEYAHFKQLITSPEEDVEKYCRDRFPAPKFIPTWEGESQARFLLSVVNPSRTQNSKSFHGGGTEEAAILTDDVSHDVFMKHLIGFAVD